MVMCVAFLTIEVKRLMRFRYVDDISETIAMQLLGGVVAANYVTTTTPGAQYVGLK